MDQIIWFLNKIKELVLFLNKAGWENAVPKIFFGNGSQKIGNGSQNPVPNFGNAILLTQNKDIPQFQAH